MVMLGGWVFSMSEAPLYAYRGTLLIRNTYQQGTPVCTPAEAVSEQDLQQMKMLEAMLVYRVTSRT